MKKIEKLLIILVSSILMTTAGGLKSEGQLFSQHLSDNSIANSDSYQKLEKPAIDSLVSNNPGRKVYNKAFGVGEKLEYSVNYGFINAGNAVRIRRASCRGRG